MTSWRLEPHDWFETTNYRDKRFNEWQGHGKVKYAADCQHVVTGLQNTRRLWPVGGRRSHRRLRYLMWAPMSAHPRDDDQQDEENPGNKEDQSPPEVIPNLDAAEPSLRSALNELTAATKRDTSGGAHGTIRRDARGMVGRDHQLAT
jgi:hypothetical protein